MKIGGGQSMVVVEGRSKLWGFSHYELVKSSIEQGEFFLWWRLVVD